MTDVLASSAAAIAADAGIFELAPVPLWLEDYSGVKALLEGSRRAGVVSLREHLAGHPDRVKECASRIRLLQVNRRTLDLFGARDLEHLTANLDQVFRGDMLTTHIEELVQLWEGQCSFASNAVNYTLGGERLDIQLKATILPGHEDTWSRVLISTEDVTDREDARPDGTLDLAGSVTRELGEETGLRVEELQVGEGWTALVEQGRIAFMREVGIDLPAEEARALMLERMRNLEEEELSDIVIVRDLTDTEKHDMPPFMRRYLEHMFDDE